MILKETSQVKLGIELTQEPRPQLRDLKNGATANAMTSQLLKMTRIYGAYNASHQTLYGQGVHDSLYCSSTVPIKMQAQMRHQLMYRHLFNRHSCHNKSVSTYAIL